MSVVHIPITLHVLHAGNQRYIYQHYSKEFCMSEISNFSITLIEILYLINV